MIAVRNSIHWRQTRSWLYTRVAHREMAAVATDNDANRLSPHFFLHWMHQRSVHPGIPVYGGMIHQGLNSSVLERRSAVKEQ